ncbi:VCBS domain-containing protein [Aeromonas dhakensis]
MKQPDPDRDRHPDRDRRGRCRRSQVCGRQRHPSAGALGSLSITEGGTWTYNVDNSKVQYLGEGETKVETFVVESVDGTTHTVTITITGVNDSAVIGGVDSGNVVEDETTRP